MQNKWLEYLIESFETERHQATAEGQATYMKHQFAFLGIPSPERHKLLQSFFSKHALPAKEEATDIIKCLWQMPEREYQYTAQELLFKYHKSYTPSDISIMEYMVTHKSWWDTIDMIAAKLMGSYFLLYPKKRQSYTDKWLASGNIWLQRCSLLFQLKYKMDTDTKLLKHCIHNLLGSNEFFINKAIGWILREYGKSNPEWVRDFAENTPLASLSYREGTRLLKK